jgi:hypothetical protein
MKMMLLATLSLGLVSTATTASVTKLSDPTKPANYTKQALLAGAQKGKLPMIVQGIFKTAKHRYAIIGDTPVKAGDAFGEYTIVAVTPTAVKVRASNSPDRAIETFSIHEQEVKSDATH